MRELKFRAWNGKKMYIPDELINNPVSVGHFDGSGYAKIEKDIVMQFTGLHDKNGKEIYEGDVLKWKESRVMEVIWGRVGWVLFSDLFKKLGFPNGDDCGEYHTKKYCIQSAVIGNVWENPELLK